MFLPEGFVANLQGLAVERLRLGILARVPKHAGEVDEAGGIVWMPLPEGFVANLQSLAVERLRLGILARVLKHAGEVVEHGGGFGRPRAVSTAREPQQLVEMMECDLVSCRPPGKYAGFVEMSSGRIQASGLVEVSSRLAPLDLNSGDLSSLESCLGGAHDGYVRLVFNLCQQRIGLREIPSVYCGANLRKLLVADIVTQAGQRRLQFADLPQGLGMGGLNIGQLAFDLYQLIFQPTALVTMCPGKPLLDLVFSLFQDSLEILYG